jgi:glycosyltransferase involved in cell wall biosynthesis
VATSAHETKGARERQSVVTQGTLVDRRRRVLHLFTDAFVLPWSIDHADPLSALTWPGTSVARYADHDRFEVIVGSLRPPQMDISGIRSVRVEVFPWNGRTADPLLLARLASWLRREQIDIVHTHLFHASLYGLAAARLAGTRVAVTTSHHSHELPISGGRAAYHLDALALRLADRVFAPCRVMRDILLYGYGLAPERTPIVLHGLDDGRFESTKDGRARVRAELNLEGRIILGALGRLYPLKQYSLLIEAFARVAGNVPESTLVIAGFGNERDSLLQQARELGIGDRVRLIGGRADVPDLMAAFDLFVHSARSESFGLVLIEAMAAGKPVVSTDVGIAPDLLGDQQAGRLVPVGDAGAYAAALATMLERRTDWPTMGREAQRRARTFTARRMVAEYEGHYETQLAEPPRG